MKSKLLPLLAGLLTAGSAHARNPEPLRLRDKPTEITSPVRRVVLVHGFLETGATFKTLRKRLEQRQIQCFIPKLRPNDGRGGLETIAERLKADIDAEFGPDEPICIVAFSMGGIVSRYYLQNLGGASRCEKFFTIASPHRGTVAAWLYPSKGAEQMRPGSAFLTELTRTQPNLDNIPRVSYWTKLDLVILPANSSVWDGAENIQHPALLHPLLLSAAPVLTDIERRLLQ